MKEHAVNIQVNRVRSDLSILYSGFVSSKLPAINGFVVPRQLVTQQKRFRVTINIQKPRKLFYQRALVTEFVTPFYERPRPIRPIWEACYRIKTRERTSGTEIHPYQRIVARECLQRLEASKMIGFLHKNSIKSDDHFDLAVALHKHGMSLKYYGRSTMACAVKGTRFEAILPLFCAPGLLVFGAEPTVEELRKIIKKTPQVILMAGILEGKLLNVNDFLKYGKMNIDEARSGLVQTLQTAGGINLNRQFNHHQSTLVSRLEQIGNKEEMSAEDVKIEETKSEDIKSE